MKTKCAMAVCARRTAENWFTSFALLTGTSRADRDVKGKPRPIYWAGTTNLHVVIIPFPVQCSTCVLCVYFSCDCSVRGRKTESAPKKMGRMM
jgi:hypothetical protein